MISNNYLNWSPVEKISTLQKITIIYKIQNMKKVNNVFASLTNHQIFVSWSLSFAALSLICDLIWFAASFCRASSQAAGSFDLPIISSGSPVAWQARARPAEWFSPTKEVMFSPQHLNGFPGRMWYGSGENKIWFGSRSFHFGITFCFSTFSLISQEKIHKSGWNKWGTFRELVFASVCNVVWLDSIEGDCWALLGSLVVNF